ncbi:glycosyltransferase family 4 protein [Paenibacillaceae bacterium WGS1546]|uniref:glycosyltransferase family 4 protein n=1 Tax=Cohnella sp. WGS1546 TaxID=3366810 RepID=UPI00372D539E
MKILLVCSDFPYPPNHGLRVDTWGRIKALSELGHRLHLVVCGKQKPSDSDMEAVSSYVEEVVFCTRRSRLADLLSAVPMQAQSRAELRRVQLADDYDYVLLEGDYVYPILNNPRIRRDRTILRVHNDEAVYFKALAKSVKNPLHKLYYLLESRKFAVLQHKIRESVDKYMFISNKEFESFRTRHPSARSLFLPPPVAGDAFQPGAFRGKHVVFIGSLFMPNNREAIEWYLTHIHPSLLKEPGYRFIVAGNTRNQGLGWLEAYDLTNVTVHDSPNSLEDIYKNGYLFVNPMQHGAGVKLKTIEAIQNGLPVVSTSVGCEGTGLADGEHILLADRPEDFLRQIKTLLDDPRRARALLDASQDFIRRQYNHQEVLRRYLHSLNVSYRTRRVM